MNIAIDIDDTITALPRLFAAITRSGEVHKVIIVSSRSNRPEARISTEQELADMGISYDELYLLDTYDQANVRCPHDDLDWHQKYLWQKVEICLREGIDIVFEDDVKYSGHPCLQMQIMVGVLNLLLAYSRGRCPGDIAVQSIP